MPFCSFINIEIHKKYLEPEVSSSVLCNFSMTLYAKFQIFLGGMRVTTTSSLSSIYIQSLIIKNAKPSPSGT